VGCSSVRGGVEQGPTNAGAETKANVGKMFSTFGGYGRLVL
jgi:hypothetical protein